MGERNSSSRLMDSPRAVHSYHLSLDQIELNTLTPSIPPSLDLRPFLQSLFNEKVYLLLASRGSSTVKDTEKNHIYAIIMMCPVLLIMFVLFGLSALSGGFTAPSNSHRGNCLLHVSSGRSISLAASKVSDVTGKQKLPYKPKATPTARSTAVFALLESSKQKTLFAIRKLENDPDYLNLERRDRAFARLLLTTAERRQGQIDKVVQKFVDQSKQSKKRAADFLCEATLRIGGAQLLFLDVPSYAALKETVEVLRMHPKINVAKSQINFVNAVLRSIDREGQEALEATSVYDNVEPWLVQKWIDSYGDENTTAIVEAAMAQSPIFISVNHEPQSSAAEREAKLEQIREKFSTEEGLEAELLPHGCIRVPEQSFGSVSTWPGYEEGEWWVQDPSATLPALALFNSLTEEGNGVEDLRVVDLCSAPGGKTAQLCSLGFGKVTAVEVSARRTKPLNDNLARLNMKELCQVVVADGRVWKPEDSARVDGVLVDAPCSATGVGSRRPDVLRKSPELEELTKIQKELAVHTVDELLDPGGIMVYATCSLLKEESEDQMDWLLSRTEGAEVETIPFLPGEIPGFDDAIDKNGWLRVIPGVLPGTLKFCDGFFVARLRRTR